MAHRVCPWWLGYLLASPIRRWIEIRDPQSFLYPYIRPGMTVLEPGPGMGFFTLPMAHLVGAAGRVIAVDIQPRMLAGLRKRASKAGVADRIETRLADEASLKVDDLQGKVDFVLAYAMVHEIPDPEHFFQQAAGTLKRGARLLFVEPAGHVNSARFAEEVQMANRAGLIEISRPVVPRNKAALLIRPA